MRGFARRGLHGEFQIGRGTGQVAGGIHLLPVLLALVQRAAEHAHRSPQVGRADGVVVDLLGGALGAGLRRGGQADRPTLHAAVHRACAGVGAGQGQHRQEEAGGGSERMHGRRILGPGSCKTA